MTSRPPPTDRILLTPIEQAIGELEIAKLRFEELANATAKMAESLVRGGGRLREDAHEASQEAQRRIDLALASLRALG